jgi:hypothetical protein
MKIRMNTSEQLKPLIGLRPKLPEINLGQLNTRKKDKKEG